MSPVARRRGFTLVELLVVLAILAVLAALLFPVFARARASAKTSACLAQFRQIGQALVMYAGDHDDVLPTWSDYWYLRTNGVGDPDSWGVDTPDRRWAAHVLSYTKSTRATRGVWRCPQAEGTQDESSVGISQPLLYDSAAGRWRHVRLAQVVTPAGTLLIGDAGYDARLAMPANLDGFHDRFVARTRTFRREAPWRHSERANYGFVDGHARSLPAIEPYPNPHDLQLPIISSLGHAHCATARWFALDDGQAAYHVRVAASEFGVNCPDAGR